MTTPKKMKMAGKKTKTTGDAEIKKVDFSEDELRKLITAPSQRSRNILIELRRWRESSLQLNQTILA